jgi:hypothetical protein
VQSATAACETRSWPPYSSSPEPMKFSFLLRFNLCLLAVALSGCGKSDHSDASAGPRTPVQEVGVVTLTPQRVAIIVRAEVEEGVNQQAILVPQRGVTRNQQGQPTALVVGANNKVELRTLHTERTIGENWLVTGGLSAGDKVIIDGLQKVAPGAGVKTIALTADGYPVAGK